MSTFAKLLAVLGASVALAVVINCGETVPVLESGARCSLNSDCKTPLVCGFERCRAECKTSRDCGGKLCVRGSEGGNVCQLDDEVECTHNSQCAGTQLCGPDRHCRDVCITDKDCVTDLLCVSRVCAKSDELKNGKLPERVSTDAGASCTYASDCPGELVCLYGRCDVECLGDKDCRIGWGCRPTTKGGDGRCYPNTPMDASADAADATDAGPVLPRVELAFANNAVCALFDQKVKCWGYNIFGSLGLGDTQNRGDKANQMGQRLPFLDFGTGRKVKALSQGLCVILDNDGLKCWGDNANGRLGLGDTLARGDAAGEMGDALPYVDLGKPRTAKAVASSGNFTCAILDTDQVKCWGANNLGQLGLGDTNGRGIGPNQMGAALPVVDLGSGRTAKAIAVGLNFTCALLDNSQVKCWGYNSAGQLGLGDTQTRGNAPGQMGDALPYVSLGTGITVKTLTASNAHICALFDNGRVKCWGTNSSGGLGLGDTLNRGDKANQMGDALPFVDVGAGRTVRSIAAGSLHTCARLDDNSVKCWGYNAFGPLGLGDTNSRGDAAGEMGNALPGVNLGQGRTARSVAVGAQTCVVLDNDRVKCFGNNSEGSLGLGDTVTRGDKPNQMGDNLPYTDIGGP